MSNPNNSTEQKRAESALEESEKKYRELVQNARCIILRMDIKGNVTFFNEYAQQFFGFGEQEILGKNVVGTIVPQIDINGNNLSLMIEDILLHSEKYAENENENMRCNGERVWISWSNRNIYGPDGSMIEILCVGTDITERRKTEKALQESETMFRGIVEQSVDGIFLTDEEGRIIEWNKACEIILGLPRNEAVGRYCWDVWFQLSRRWESTSQYYESLKSGMLKFLETGVSPWGESVLQEKIERPDGICQYIQEVAFAVKTIRGYRGCAIIRNITSIKEAEERDRLHRQQLIQADKMASLGILVSGVAHEINNPNNFIHLNGEILSKVWNDLTPVLKEYYERHGDFSLSGIPYTKAHEKIRGLITGISEGAIRIEKIVDSLKTFTRQDSGDMDANLKINEVVESALLIVNNLIKKSTNHFTAAYGTGIPPVRGNFQRMEQVVINLLANACQALPDRGRAIRIATGFDREANTVTITVEDEGIGISPEDMPHIMDPFFTTKRNTGGTGLGLSISYNCVKEHGGELVLFSEQGKGATATITLPALEPV
jgi:PAS domain S-box-containing protein